LNIYGNRHVARLRRLLSTRPISRFIDFWG